jgi:hypothetical protein
MGLVFAGMGMLAAAQAAQGGMVTLLDGTNMNNFTPSGNANWRIGPGPDNTPSTVYADLGTGFLVTKDSYADFRIRAEVWIDTPGNSGIFIRCDNPNNPGANTCYEVNLFDTRPDPSYGTGAIVNTAKVNPMPKAGGKWNVMEIEARGSQLTVRLNGQQTASANDNKHARGRIALQYGGGKVMWRKVEIQAL